MCNFAYQKIFEFTFRSVFFLSIAPIFFPICYPVSPLSSFSFRSILKLRAFLNLRAFVLRFRYRFGPSLLLAFSVACISSQYDVLHHRFARISSFNFTQFCVYISFYFFALQMCGNQSHDDTKWKKRKMVKRPKIVCIRPSRHKVASKCHSARRTDKAIWKLASSTTSSSSPASTSCGTEKRLCLCLSV